MLSTDFPYFHKDCPISVTTHNGTCIGVDFRDVLLSISCQEMYIPVKHLIVRGLRVYRKRDFINKKSALLMSHAKINANKSSKMADDE